MTIILSLFLPLYMAVISRACGGWFRLPGENFLYALPYALPIVAVSNNWIAGALFGIFGVLCATVGKGQANRVFMDLGTWTGPERKPHNYEPFLQWLMPKTKFSDPYKYDYIGLMLVGLAPALVPAVICGFYSPVSGAILALGGVCKSAGYGMGYVFNRRYMTETGEFLTGLFAGLSIALVMLYL